MRNGVLKHVFAARTSRQDRTLGSVAEIAGVVDEDVGGQGGAHDF